MLPQLCCINVVVSMLFDMSLFSLCLEIFRYVGWKRLVKVDG
jgi:hypothetical protein